MLPVTVIAGELQTIEGEDIPVEPHAMQRQDQCWPTRINWETYSAIADRLAGRIHGAPAVGVPVEEMLITGSLVRGRNFGDYKLYELPVPTTVAARQIKQVQFLDRSGIPVTRVCRAGTDDEFSQRNVRLSASIFVRIQNNARGRLARPLPAGGVAAMATLRDGSAILVGEDRIGDMPVGVPVEFFAGPTSDVSAELRVMPPQASENIGPSRRNSVEVAIANNKNETVSFAWRQAKPYEGNIVSASRRSESREDEWLWTFALKPRERVVLRYVVEDEP
jgi:hypothetical protein